MKGQSRDFVVNQALKHTGLVWGGLGYRERKIIETKYLFKISDQSSFWPCFAPKPNFIFLFFWLNFE